MMLLPVLVLLLQILLQIPPTTPTTTKIIFGSCSKVHEPQPLWTLIQSRHPDLFIWGGDNIYSDIRLTTGLRLWGKESPTLSPGERPRFKPRTLAQHADMYKTQQRHPDYRQFVQSSTPIVGTWDDHDCGINDADKHFIHKQERQQLHLDFLNVPLTDARRTRRGVYASHKVGRIKVILLDVRYHRDAWPWHAGYKGDGVDSDMLGAEQWSWLAEELVLSSPEEKEAIDLILVVSGIQVLPLVLMADEKHETWFHFQHSRQRLIDLLQGTASAPAILLSGDVHFAEISECGVANGVASGDDGQPGGEKNHPKDAGLPKSFRLLEFTSSGMTHAWAGPWNWPKPMPAPIVFQWVWWWWRRVGVHPWRTAVFPGLNFGEIVYDHDRKEVMLKAIGVDNRTKFSINVSLGELVGGKEGAGAGAGGVGGECTPVHGMPSGNRVMLSKAVFLGVPGVAMAVVVGWWGRWCWRWRSGGEKGRLKGE